MARQSLYGAADPQISLDSGLKPTIVDFDDLAKDSLPKPKPTTQLGQPEKRFDHFAYRGGFQRVVPDSESDDDQPKPIYRPMSSAMFGDTCRSGMQRHQRLEGINGNRMFGPESKTRKVSPSDSPAAFRRRKRAIDPFASDNEDSPKATASVAPAPRRALQNLQKGVRRITKAFSEREAEREEEPDDSSREESPLIIEDTPEPVRPAMRMRVDAKKDYGAKMPDLEEVGQLLEEDAADGILQQCSDISERLKNALQSQGGNKYEALEGGSQLADIETLKRACGENAKYVKSYQLIGINFLLLLLREGVEGSILADEMGLGKTAQTILFLGCLKELHKDAGPHIVICPASLLENWQREFERWCPGLEVVAYYGPERTEIRRNLESIRMGNKDASDNGGEGDEVDPIDLDNDSEEESSEEESDEGSVFGEDEEDVDAGQDCKESKDKAAPGQQSDAPFNVMLTCYNLFERDNLNQRTDRAFLRKFKWSHIILDEAHAVKNSNAQRTIRLNTLAEKCQRRIMLTGTPLQNDLTELQNLLRFLMPKLFTQEQAEELEVPKDPEAIDKLAERMKNLLKPFVLRRLKTEVAQQLAAKQHKLFSLAMTPVQASAYDKAIAQLKKNVGSEALSGDKEAVKEKANKVVKKLGQKKIGNAFVALRKIALHPLLARQIVTDDRLAELANLARQKGVFGENATLARVKEELEGYSDFQIHHLAEENGSAFRSFVLSPSHIFSSAKCQFLAKILPELQAAGSRPLIFSQWTMVLDILEWLLQTLNLPYCRLDGSTAVAERLTTVDLFNNEANGVFAFLLSSRAGGQGLNLTGADTVILHDVDFNPQIDRQAEDRCHRLGQTKPVTVMRLVTANTVDAGIHALAEKKLKLDAAVLDGLASSAKQAKAMENAGMSELLQTLLTGEDEGQPKSPEAQASVAGGTFEHIAELPDPSEALMLTPTTRKGNNKSSIDDIIDMPDTDRKTNGSCMSPTSTPRSSTKSEQTKSPDFRNTTAKSGKQTNKGSAKSKKSKHFAAKTPQKSSPAVVHILDSSPETNQKKKKQQVVDLSPSVTPAHTSKKSKSASKKSAAKSGVKPAT